MGQVRTSWILDIRDMISRPVQNATRAADQLNESMDRVRQNAHRTGESIRKAFSLGNLKDSLMDIPGMRLFTNPYVVMGAGIGAITKLGMEAEKSAVSFDVLLGSSEKAEKMLSQIATMAAKTPFEKMELQNAAQMMLNFGVAEEKVLEYMTQLGDIAAGDSQKFQSLALVFGQVTSAGKLSGQDLLQFINAGFNPLKELSDMTGEAYSSLQDKMSKGMISADMVASAMNRATSEGGKFYQMMDKMSTTTAGRISTVLDNIKERTAAMFAYIAPLIANFLELVDIIIPPIFKAFDTVVRVVSSVVGWFVKYQDVLKYVGIAVATFYTIVQAKTIALYALVGAIKMVTVVTEAWATVTKVLNLLFVSSPVGWIALAIGALAAAVVYCWDKFAGFRAFLITLFDTIKQLGKIILEYVVNRFKEAISGVSALASAFKKLFSGDFAGAYDAATKGFSQIWGSQSKSEAWKKASEIDFANKYSRTYFEEKAKEKNKPENSLVISTGTSSGNGVNPTVSPQLSNMASKAAGNVGLGGSGISGSGRSVTLNVHMNNNFSMSGEGDVKRIVERVKEELVSVMTDVVPSVG